TAGPPLTEHATERPAEPPTERRTARRTEPGTTTAGCARATAKSGVEILSARPSCRIYRSMLGTGWQVRGTGTNVTPGQQPPGTDEATIRIQKRVARREDLAAATILADTPVPVGARTTLRLRVFGGREFGTILRVSASGAAGRAGSKSVVLQAPPLRWKSFVLPVGSLTSGRLRRVDLVIATDQMPQAYEFFVDDVELEG
ncbi:hypothetical protein, partial [Nonomuraea lactucae]|uniref:hypothetical protein n=1 Tax=Nonomuraea lactucae TaxID=2249762 RepID=UPI0013B43705